jgi:hypothetical protein
MSQSIYPTIVEFNNNNIRIDDDNGVLGCTVQDGSGVLGVVVAAAPPSVDGGVLLTDLGRPRFRLTSTAGGCDMVQQRVYASTLWRTRQ